jgi:hypothetical protein
VDRVDPSQPLTDEGAMPNQVMRALSEWGVRPMGPLVPGAFSDCDPGNVNDEPTLADLEADATTTLIGWYRITSTGSARIEDCRKALAAKMTIGVGTFVDTAYEQWRPGQPPAGAPDLSDPNGGGHWQYVKHYDTMTTDRTVFDVRGSWTEDFGDHGDALTSEEWIQACSDLYVIAPNVQRLP